MNKILVKALKVAEESMPFYSMIKAYDCGDFYYFSCVRKGTDIPGNGPCIDKRTQKIISVDSSTLVSFDWNKTIKEIINVEDIRNNLISDNVTKK